MRLWLMVRRVRSAGTTVAGMVIVILLVGDVA
jgi:hypothetical protein